MESSTCFNCAFVTNPVPLLSLHCRVLGSIGACVGGVAEMLASSSLSSTRIANNFSFDTKPVPFRPCTLFEQPVGAESVAAGAACWLNVTALGCPLDNRTSSLVTYPVDLFIGPPALSSSTSPLPVLTMLSIAVSGTSPSPWAIAATNSCDVKYFGVSKTGPTPSLVFALNSTTSCGWASFGQHTLPIACTLATHENASA
eukprot:CAMPEP_0176227930 /NCGR_PEP_ID=MMETSP0121_2-20121125/23013_1 /TAXON_ID=160619 /ORGANISM="Kryptoperidinium foliaceum, Strain CCMP 1326" /LENGTH=199 /DNA_ID=CAMNT_0017567209 /DNA_START=253 /DNA_END=848 /DNA_ORIENTATION=-